MVEAYGDPDLKGAHIRGCCPLLPDFGSAESSELARAALAGQLERTAPVYRLFAVVYHHGRGADGGHYSCHVRQRLDDHDSWIFYDDASWQREPLERVLANKGPLQTAYLLMYIRTGERSAAG